MSAALLALTLLVQPSAWSATEVARADALAGVVDAERGPDGTVYVLQFGQAEIARFTAEGEPIGPWGGRGQGPGELLMPMRLGLEGGRLWVADGGQPRFQFYGADGREAGVRAVPRAFNAEQFAAGRLIGFPPVLARLIASGAVQQRPLLSWAEGVPAPDTIAWLDVRHTFGSIPIPGNPPGFGFEAPQPFSDADFWAVDDGRVAVVERNLERVYRVTVYEAAGGRQLWSREYPFTPQPITARERAEAVRQMVAPLLRPGLPVQIQPARAERDAGDVLYVPPHHPPVAAVVAGADGTTWVQQHGGLWLVLDERGEPLGTVRVPGRLLRAARGWALAVMETDADGFQAVVSYRIREDP